MGRLVDIRPDERPSAFAAFAILFAVTAGHTMLETGRDALFLARLPATRLPWVYLAIAAVGVALTVAQRRRKAGSVPMALLASAGVTAVLWLASARPGTAFLYVVYVWSGLFASWLVVRFWLLLGSIFTSTQAKRLYGFVGAGSILGAVGGSAAARAIAGALEARHLLLAAALTFLAAAAPASLLRARVDDEASAPTRESGALAILARDALAKRILGVAIASTLTFTVVDYLFKSSVTESVPPARLGAFFATVGIVLNGAALLVQVVGTGWIMRAVGVHRALWVLPLLLSGGAIGVLAGGGLAAALALKGADGALRHSVARTSTELLYVPIPEARRAKIKPLVDLIGQRGGQAAASLGILALAALGAGARTFAVAILVLCAACVAIAATIRRPYLDLFRATLREGRVDVDEASFAELDRETLEALFGALSSRKVPEVLAALDLLERYGRARLVPPLVLYHPQKAVVLRALELFAKCGEDHFVPIAEWLDQSPDPELRAAALRARCAVSADDEMLRAKTKDAAPAVRATALVALVARGTLPGDEAELRKIAREPNEELKVAVARAIRDAGSHARALEDVLVTMLDDASPNVEAEVATAMGRLGDARFVPRLVAMLPRRVPAVAAREALAEIGPPALEALEKALCDPKIASEVRAAIPRAIAKFPPEDAARVLLERLANEEDGLVRFRAIRALGRLRDDDPDLPLDTALLTDLAKRTLRGAIRDLDWRVSLARGATKRTRAYELLAAMLRDKETHALERLFRVLDLLRLGESFERIWRGLQSKSAKARASSRELIENLVPPPLRDPLLAMIDDVSDEGRLARAAPFYVAAPLALEPLLAAMALRGGELAMLARYHALEIGLELDAGAHEERGEFAAGIARAIEHLSSQPMVSHAS